ncbi:unnamed protein product [Periconia digitata]|uniref:Uncharacterized protein n=1 Tax=Periconia digitata TaxID=1303443 RepID=A0A9W4UHA4_9PLEO|nr:unnamed protein product [Periconia digitata]
MHYTPTHRDPEEKKTRAGECDAHWRSCELLKVMPVGCVLSICLGQVHRFISIIMAYSEKATAAARCMGTIEEAKKKRGLMGPAQTR